MMVVYHEYISSHSHAVDVSSSQPSPACFNSISLSLSLSLSQTLVSLTVDSSFKNFLTFLESKPACLGMTLEQLLSVPLKRVIIITPRVNPSKFHANALVLTPIQKAIMYVS